MRHKILSARILGLAVAAAALLGADAATAPANAQPSCKNDRIAGKSEIRAFRNAENEAKEKWEKLAEERFGRSYRKWENAKDTKVECEDAKSPRLGLSAKVCTAFGRPCSGGDNTEVVRERERDKADRRSDARDRDRDRDWFRRDDWYSRYSRRAYDAAMRHQDYLAKRRRLKEKWAYRREMAYWRNLYRRRAHGWWD